MYGKMPYIIKECQVIEQHQMLQLSVEESKAFVDAILNPPEPNQALREAVLRYHQRT